MAFPIKGSSKIVVDDEEYRWRIRQKPTYCEGAFAEAMTVSIQSSESPRCVLLIVTDSPRPDNWLQYPAESVTPGLVQHYIRTALNRGWQPNTPGSAFSILESEM